MPSSDSADDHIKKRGLLIPRTKPSDTLKASEEYLQALNEEAPILPTVVSTASVRWTGRDGAPSTDISSRVFEETGLPAPDCRPSAAFKKAEAKKLKRKQIQEAALKIKAGDKCYITLRAYPEYEDECNYPTPIDKTFVLGIYGEVIKGKGRGQIRKLEVPVFKLTHEVDIEWIESWGLQLELPEESKPMSQLWNILTYNIRHNSRR